nr:hypothetical protein [Pseudomonas coronafaciens]
MTCPSGGVASVAQEGLLDGYGRIGSGLMGGYQDEPLMSSADLFRGRISNAGLGYRSTNNRTTGARAPDRRPVADL